MKVCLVFLVVIFSTVVFADCDMMALIKQDEFLSDMTDSPSGSFSIPAQYMEFIENFSSSTTNNDGYGILYYTEGGGFYLDPDDLGQDSLNTGDPNNQAWYQIGDGTYYTGGSEAEQWDLDTATEKLIDNPSTLATIILGHARLGEDGEGNHPFRLEIDNDPSKTYSFIHNGTLSSLMKNTLFNELDTVGWFDEYSSNWTDSVNVNYWIDSEVLFHWIMYHINELNGDVIQGIRNAITDTIGSYDLFDDFFDDPYQSGDIWYDVTNFILSDGNNLYAYRNSTDNGHELGYKLDTDFIAIKTDDMTGFIELSQHDLLYITQVDYDYYEFNNIASSNWDDIFFSGDITSNTTWNSGKYITGDVNVDDNITLTIDATINFITQIEFNIEGTVTLQDDAELNIKHGSEVLVDGSGAKLELDWGCVVKGDATGYYETLPPGVPSGAEDYYPGDRITVQNQGVITTKTITDYQNHASYPNNVPTINIYSSSGEKWDGITIDGPDDVDDEIYWFVNCDIEDICDFVLKGTVRPFGKLKMFKTEFHDNVQLLVRDRHELEADSCDFYDNTSGIKVYNSPADLSYCNITENGTGLYLNYASSDQSYIDHCDISDNDGCGLITKDRYIDFEDNYVDDNGYDGIKSYSGGYWDDFMSNFVRDNGWTEYCGYPGSYSWAGDGNTISDASYSNSIDQYLLKAYGWSSGDPQIDVSGNTISTSDTTRFWPYFSTFYFGTKRDSGPEILYADATEYMSQGDYESARSLFEEILDIYPDSFEAPSSIQMIYFIENFTNQDYPVLLRFIDGIYAEEGTILYRVKRDVITRTYMQMEEFNLAIDRLEEVISNPANEIELTEALIDEAYCYIRLVEEGERFLPDNSTMKPQTFEEFQLISEDLENRFYEGVNPTDDVVNTSNISLSNYPNPFNPSTIISFTLPEESDVKLTIYNIKGQIVKSNNLIDLDKGHHEFQWNGKDSNNKSVSSGIYFFKVETSSSSALKKMMLLK